MPYTRLDLIGTTVSDSSITRQYYFNGPATDAEVYFTISQFKQPLFGLQYLSSQYVEVDAIPGDWYVTVTWESISAPLTEVEYRFNFQAPSAHIKQSLGTISYHADGENETDPAQFAGGPDFEGAINVVIDGGKKRVEGFDLAPPAEVFTLTYSTDSGTVTRQYQRKVEDMVGKVNNKEFADCLPGTLLLSRVTGGKTGTNVWVIEFGFAYVAKGHSIPVGGGIVVPEKDGHDLLWVFYGETDDVNYKDTVPRPVSAYVERIWPRDDFRKLGLPGFSGGLPVANFSVSAGGGLAVTVDGSTSHDADGTIVSYDWDWGDGTAHGSGVTSGHTYAAAGSYEITLTVTDDDGNSNTAAKIVTVP